MALCRAIIGEGFRSPPAQFKGFGAERQFREARLTEGELGFAKFRQTGAGDGSVCAFHQSGVVGLEIVNVAGKLGIGARRQAVRY